MKKLALLKPARDVPEPWRMLQTTPTQCQDRTWGPQRPMPHTAASRAHGTQAAERGGGGQRVCQLSVW